MLHGVGVRVPSAALLERANSCKSLKTNRFSEIFLFPEKYEKAKKCGFPQEKSDLSVYLFGQNENRYTDKSQKRVLRSDLQRFAYVDFGMEIIVLQPQNSCYKEGR